MLIHGGTFALLLLLFLMSSVLWKLMMCRVSWHVRYKHVLKVLMLSNMNFTIDIYNGFFCLFDRSFVNIMFRNIEI